MRLFTEVFEAAVAETRKGLQEHPSPEALMTYQRDKLFGSSSSCLHLHLTYCPLCTTAILDMEAFPDVELRRKELDPEAVRERAWQAISISLGISEGADEDHSPEVQSPNASGNGVRLVQLLVAALLLAVIGLSSSVVHLRMRVTVLSEPQANIFVYDLLAVEEGELRDPEAGDSVVIPPGMDRVVLILNVGDVRPYEEHWVEILDWGGSVLWHRRGLVRAPEGSFSIGLTRDLLPAGQYRLGLYGLVGDETSLLATYVIRVAHRPWRSPIRRPDAAPASRGSRGLGAIVFAGWPDSSVSRR